MKRPTNTNTAIKVYDLLSGYVRERNIYLRLKERSIDSIRNFKVPRIIDWNDDLFILNAV
jgi:hypothetical protein